MSIRVIRSFVVVGDLFQGTSVFRFSDEWVSVKGKQTLTGSLVRISKDDAPRHVEVTDFFVHENHLGFVAFDADQNLLVYSYCPQERDTQGGRMLVKHADFSVKCSVTTSLSLRCYERIAPMMPLEPAERHLLLYGSKEGTVGLMLPITESRYRRLQMLQSRLTTGMQHRAGLNPRGYRAVSRVDRHGARRNILDGNLLSLYFGLGLVEQGEFAKRIGTTPEQIIADLCALAEARACL